MELRQSTELPLDAPIQARAPGCIVPLIALQRLLWDSLVRQGAPLNTRVCALSVRIQGPLNLVALERSVEFVRQRHESLRTRIVTVNSTPIQHVDPPQEYHLDVIDLSNQSFSDALSRTSGSAQEFLGQRIDISIGPLFASKVWKLNDCEHVFVLALDHIVSDGASYGILSREIWTSYGHYVSGSPFNLPALPVQFPDYAVWQHRTHTDWKKKHEPYWRQHMAGVKRVSVPWGTASVMATSPVEAQHIPLGHSMSEKLRAAAQSEGVSLHLLVLSIYAIVMACWCNRDDLIVRYISHGRQRRPELQSVIGFVVNWLNLRIRLEQHSFQELLLHVKREVSDALEHQDYNRVPGFIPECQTELEFHWQHSGRTARSKSRPEIAGHELRMQPFNLRAPNWSPRFWPVFYDTPAGISVTVYFQPKTIPPTVVEKFGRNLRLVASEYLDRPLTRAKSVWMKMR